MRLPAGFALLATVVAAMPAAGQEALRQRIDTTVSLAEGGTLAVDVYSGRVSVTGARGSGVRVRGTVDRGGLDIRSRANSVRISMEHHGAKPAADLDITVPTGTRVILDGFSARFSVVGVQGEADVETLSGSIAVKDAVGRVTIESVSGDLDADGVRGDLRAESVSGTVSVRNVQGDIAAESVSGRITIAAASSSRVRAETVGGAMSFDGIIDPAGNYSFTTHSGSLTLAVPANAGASVSLETFSGTVESDFPVTLESGANRRAGESQYEFRIGDGRSRIVLETFSGNIRIQRSARR